MKTRHTLAVLGVLALQADVQALTPPSDSDGPIRLMSCVVSPNGILQAEVDNQSSDAMSCSIRCEYKISDQTFSQWFEARIPKQFNGRIGHVDAVGAKAGNYSGQLGKCVKTDPDTGITLPEPN